MSGGWIKKLMGSPKIGNDLQTTCGNDIVVKLAKFEMILVMGKCSGVFSCGEVFYVDQFEWRLKSNHV